MLLKRKRAYDSPKAAPVGTLTERCWPRRSSERLAKICSPASFQSPSRLKSIQASRKSGHRRGDSDLPRFANDKMPPENCTPSSPKSVKRALAGLAVGFGGNRRPKWRAGDDAVVRATVGKERWILAGASPKSAGLDRDQKLRRAGRLFAFSVLPARSRMPVIGVLSSRNDDVFTSTTR